jgi:hypothetical protein
MYFTWGGGHLWWYDSGRQPPKQTAVDKNLQLS